MDEIQSHTVTIAGHELVGISLQPHLAMTETDVGSQPGKDLGSARPKDIHRSSRMQHKFVSFFHVGLSFSRPGQHALPKVYLALSSFDVAWSHLVFLLVSWLYCCMIESSR